MQIQHLLGNCQPKAMPADMACVIGTVKRLENTVKFGFRRTKSGLNPFRWGWM